MNTSDLRLDLINEIMKMDDNTLISVRDVIQSKVTSKLEPWQKEILNERIKMHEENPDSGTDWETTKRRLLANL